MKKLTTIRSISREIQQLKAIKLENEEICCDIVKRCGSSRKTHTYYEKVEMLAIRAGISIGELQLKLDKLNFEAENLVLNPKILEIEVWLREYYKNTGESRNDYLRALRNKLK